MYTMLEHCSRCGAGKKVKTQYKGEEIISKEESEGEGMASMTGFTRVSYTR